MPVVRADVAGSVQDLMSHGSSGIVDREGRILAIGQRLQTSLLVADIDVGVPEREHPQAV